MHRGSSVTVQMPVQTHVDASRTHQVAAHCARESTGAVSVAGHVPQHLVRVHAIEHADACSSHVQRSAGTSAARCTTTTSRTE